MAVESSGRQCHSLTGDSRSVRPTDDHPDIRAILQSHDADALVIFTPLRWSIVVCWTVPVRHSGQQLIYVKITEPAAVVLFDIEDRTISKFLICHVVVSFDNRQIVRDAEFYRFQFYGGILGLFFITWTPLTSYLSGIGWLKVRIVVLDKLRTIVNWEP